MYDDEIILQQDDSGTDSGDDATIAAGGDSGLNPADESWYDELGFTDEQKEVLRHQKKAKELLDRVNDFLYEEEQLSQEELSDDIARVAEETGLSAEQVHAVMDSILGIMEERRKERGIERGGAHPAYVVRKHTRSRHFWGR